MEKALATRLLMTGLGIMAGLAVYALTELDRLQLMGDKPLMLLSVFATSFFLSVLAMTGPLRLPRALTGAVAIALFVAISMWLSAFSFTQLGQMLEGPHTIIATLVLTFVPMPFWIAYSRGNWRDYPTLFVESWGVVIRYAAAWAFVALAWGVVFLSDGLLSIVGLTFIDHLIDIDPVPYLLTGALLGLALGVVQDFSDYLSPFLILRLLRLLLPAVLLVSLLFLFGMLVQGGTGLFNSYSFTLTLLLMAAAATALITSVVDQADEDAAQGRLLPRLAQAMSLALPVMAGLGAWAIGSRVWHYGWTPDRVFVAEIAALGLGYGLLYAVAVLRGAGWMARIRQANIVMAVGLVLVAFLAMTPLLNAERISTASVMARLEDGRIKVEDLPARLLRNWGKAGEAALAELQIKAQQPGQEALAQRLQTPQDRTVAGPDRAVVLAEIARLLPLQPVGADATRDIYLEALDTGRLTSLRDSCLRRMPGGAPGCVMVVADLLPRAPGEEGIIVEYFAGGFVTYTGLRMDGPQGPMIADVQVAGDSLPQFREGEALITAWQAAPPAAVAVPLNQFELPMGGGVLLLP